MCTLSSVLDPTLYYFQDAEYAEFPCPEDVPGTTSVKVEALDCLTGQLGSEPEVCFLTFCCVSY